MTRALVFTALAALALAAAGCGGIGKAQTNLRTAVDAEKPSLDRCYEQALVRDETLSGSMTVVMRVTEKGGTVESVDITSSTVDDPALNKCVESTLVGVQIDPKPKANLEVEYTLQFSPKA